MVFKFDAASGSKLQEKDMTSKLGISHLANGDATAKYNQHTDTILVTFRYGMLNGHQAGTLWSVDPNNLGNTRSGS